MNLRETYFAGFLLCIGFSALTGCAGPVPEPDKSTSVVIFAPQEFERHGRKVDRFVQSSSYQYSPYFSTSVQEGEKLLLFPQATIDDVRDWRSIGVFVHGAGNSDVSFRQYLFGPFYEPNKCFLAFFEPVKLAVPKAGFDYELAPRIEEVQCGVDPNTYGSRDFTIP